MKKGSKPQQILRLIVEATYAGIDTYSSRRKGRQYDYEELIARQKSRERWARKQAITRLVKQKMIRERKIGKRVFLELTEKGKQQGLLQTIREKRVDLPGNKVCLVSFDIPEHLSRVRRALRTLLRESGFTQAHKSVWESQKDVVKELQEFVKYTKMSKWIRVYVADEKNLE